MNEEQLKKLWQGDRSVPMINFAAFEKSLTLWQNKLRIKTRIDIGVQILAAGLSMVSIYYYPKLIVFEVIMIALTVWYVRELRHLSEIQSSQTHSAAVKNSLKVKIRGLQRYFCRTRIAMYVLSPLLTVAVFYGVGAFEKSPMAFGNLLMLIGKCLIIFEIFIIVFTEIYLKTLYKPALSELESLSGQLETAE